MNILIVPLIVALVYFLIEGYKYIVKNDKKYTYYIPVIAGALGAVIGLVAYFIAPNTMNAQNVLVAIVYGIASGLSATGANQIIKQIAKKNNDNNDDDKSDQ